MTYYLLLKVDEKSELQPDYIFEIHEGGIVHKFNYITGLDKNDYGNLYNDDSVYIVSRELTMILLETYGIIEP